jgi:hypothetical protein
VPRPYGTRGSTHDDCGHPRSRDAVLKGMADDAVAVVASPPVLVAGFPAPDKLAQGLSLGAVT